MGSRAIVFSFSVTCYLLGILCRNASGSVSTFARVFTVNDTSNPNVMTFKTENTRIAESIEVDTKLDGITFFLSPKNSHKKKPLKPKLSYEPLFVKNESVKSSSDYRNIRGTCLRYCIENLEENDDYFQNITFVWSFVTTDEEKEVTDNFSIKSTPNLTNLKIHSLNVSKNNKSSINLDNCKIYFISDCSIMKKNLSINNQKDEFYTYSEIHTQRENINSFLLNITPKKEFLTKLVHNETKLSGHTEADVNIDTNVRRIVIRTFGNLTCIVLTASTNRTMQQPRIPISLTHTYITKGVVIGARNLPPGRLRVKLTGVENSKYSFDVTTIYFEERMYVNKEINTKNTMKIDIESVNKFNKERNIHADNGRLNNNKVPKLVFERSVEIIDSRNNDDDKILNDFFDKDMLFSSISVLENINNSRNLENKSLSFISFYGDVKFPGDTASNKMFNEKLIVPKQQRIQVLSEVASLNENIDMNVINNDTNLSKEIINKNEEKSAQFARNGEEFFEQLTERRNVIEINAKSSLIATPGTTHRVVFDVMNNCFLPVRYAIRARSTPLRIYNILPVYLWLQPGQTSYVTVDIIVPLGTQNSINTLTLSIDETQISQKTVHIYVQDSLSRNFDDVKPTIEYSFNSNCAGKVSKDRCDKTFWSADIIVQDSDSGLKRVISTPNRIYPRTEFISGTKERITFYYSSTCCLTTAKLTAIDVFENQYSRTIDVTEWDNLSQGEIAAISLGALLLLLLLILLIIAIVYCFRRRSSHDLPYSQRYGSRPRESRPERTSF